MVAVKYGDLPTDLEMVRWLGREPDFRPMRGSAVDLNKISRRTPLGPNVSSGFFVPFPSAQNRKRTMKKPKNIETPWEPEQAKNDVAHILFVPVPSSWYGKSDNEVMTFNEALKALNSHEHKKAVSLMEQIDKQFGVEGELSSGVNESGGGSCVVIVQSIKTPLSSEKLRYVAAVKGKALMKSHRIKSCSGNCAAASNSLQPKRLERNKGSLKQIVLS
jgi:hypothetical protein